MAKKVIEAVRSLQAGKIEPVYFLNGNDFFLQHIFIQELEKAMKVNADPEKLYLNSDEIGYVAVLQELNSVSMFSQPRLMVLRNPTSIAGRNRDELLSYCKSPNVDNCLVIIIDKYDTRMKLIKSLSAILGTVNVSPPFQKEMGMWIDHLLNEYGLTATEEAIDRLIELSGDSVFSVHNELAKIALGVEEDSEIQEEDVMKYATGRRSYFPWQFLDAVGSDNLSDAVKIGKRLLDHGSEISALISLMTTMFQEILFTQMENGQSPPVFWLSKKVKQRLPHYRTVYSRERVNAVFRHLAEADNRVKTSSEESSLILISLLHKITMSYD